MPALLGVVLAIVAYPPSAFERSLERFLATIPGSLDPVWGFLSDLVWLWAVVLVVVALVRRRFGVVGEALASLVLAALIGLGAARLDIGSWPDVGDAILGTSNAPAFPNVRVAVATAVVVAVAPDLVRPLRKLGRWILLLGVVGAAIVGGGTPFGTLASVLIAVVAGAGVRLLLGTSAGRPGLADVAAGLAQLGVRAGRLEVAERQVAGVFHVRALDDDGRPLLVKVYGRDAYDTQLVAKLWRRIWYRGSGAAIGLGRLQSTEHEAFVTLLARKRGPGDSQSSDGGGDARRRRAARAAGRRPTPRFARPGSTRRRAPSRRLARAGTARRAQDRASADRSRDDGRRLGTGRLRRLRRRDGGSGRGQADDRSSAAPHNDGEPRGERARARCRDRRTRGRGRRCAPPVSAVGCVQPVASPGAEDGGHRR